MKNLFDKDAYQEVMNRLTLLHPDSKRLWGKMTVAQMLAHSCEAFKVPLSEKKLPRMFLGILIGWAMKAKLYNDSPWQKSLPTAPNFIIKDERNFTEEMQRLTQMIQKFHVADAEAMSKKAHPLFGKFTAEQWGKSMYKHLDHHLKQFGV